MKRFRIAILAIAVFPLTSCVTHLDDEQLTAKPNPPVAFTPFGGQAPRLKTWADFYFYPQASLELEDMDGSWTGHGAIPGHGTVVTLNEGSAIENTTAHPQYYQIYFLLPAELQAGQVIPLRTAAGERPISRTKRYGDSTDTYVRAQVGELTVDGMNGYDIPVVRPVRSKKVGTAKVLSLSPTKMTLRLDATIPLRFAYLKPATHYRLQVHRTYHLKRKRAGSAR